MDMKEQSLDFLWITYFGITKTEAEKNKEKAAFACADRAYRDLCRRIPYFYSSSEIEKNKKEYKDYIDLKDSFREAVCKYIIKSIEGTEQIMSILSIKNFSNLSSKILPKKPV